MKITIIKPYDKIKIGGQNQVHAKNGDNRGGDREGPNIFFFKKVFSFYFYFSFFFFFQK